ncbi:MAG: tRNA pseudouridine(55) synthase TruB [Gammaproteobacteria bacterium]
MSGVTQRRSRRHLDGLLLLDKPSGVTSNGALQRVKWLYQARKAGHTGSLDPLASGMLPICFGEATKFAGYLLDANKTYRVQARFGIRTDTGDAEGQPVEQSNAPGPTPAAMEVALASLRGPIQQVPPMYSALKVQGQRLYALARAGKEVPRAPRPVHIHEFVLETYDPETPVFRVECTKGTYIRTLIEDLAAQLGTLAHVVALRRLSVGPFSEEAMVDLAALEAVVTPSGADGGPPAGDDACYRSSAQVGILDAFLKPLDAVLPEWPMVELEAALAVKISQGATVNVPVTAVSAGPVRIYSPGRQFLGIGDLEPGGRRVARRLVASKSVIPQTGCNSDRHMV